jgi:uncharacterized membrane protein YgcG
MISWFKTNKALRLKVTQLEQELRGTKMIVGDLERHLVRAQAQASSWRGIAETAQKKLNPPKVDHLQRQLQVERTARQAVQTNKKIIKQMSPAPRPKPVEEDSGRRAGRDPDPMDALMHVALGAGAAMVLDSIFSDDKPSQSCEAPASSPSVESGGGGDFGGGGASGSWD